MARRTLLKILLIFVVIFGLLGTSKVAWSQGRSDQAFERAKQAQEGHTHELMAINGVVGTAVGLEGERPVVLVLLERGGLQGIPDSVEGVPVKLMVTGKIHALADPTARFDRPVPIGVSTGHPAITAGTIGCRVTDGTNVYALSNNHVYADENGALIGDSVLQPGPYDGGSMPDDYLGQLAGYVEIKFDGTDNTIDAAIAATTTDLLGTATPSDGYGVPNSTTIEPAIRMEVKKYGRTTGLTTGKIGGVNVIVNVGYDTGTARFVNQILIRGGGFSAGGDSGSLIVTDDDNCNPVGLLFAGSSSATIANPINAVLTYFGVTVDDTPQGPVAPVADFVGSPTSGFAPLTVNFTDLSTGDPTSWSWDFGDGVGTSTEQNPPYTYNEPGKYTVTLTATNSNGSDSETKTDYINVTEQGVGVTVVDITPDSMSAGSTVDVTIAGSGFADGASVTFENGSGPAPTASVSSVSATNISATITAKSGGPPRERVWDVRVTNTDGSTGVLVGGFTVTP